MTEKASWERSRVAWQPGDGQRSTIRLWHSPARLWHSLVCRACACNRIHYAARCTIVPQVVASRCDHNALVFIPVACRRYIYTPHIQTFIYPLASYQNPTRFHLLFLKSFVIFCLHLHVFCLHADGWAIFFYIKYALNCEGRPKVII
jgi:hypothetical protein